MRKKRFDGMEIPARFARFIDSKEGFFKTLKECADEAHPEEEEEGFYERDHTDEESFDRMTETLEGVLDDGEELRRKIRVGDVDTLVKEIREGKNGLGISWSYTVGHVCASSRETRYTVQFVARVLTPESIDYETTYCKDQRDVGCGNPDFEVTLNVGGKVFLKKLEVKDNVSGEFWTVTMNLPVTISDVGNDILW